MFSALSGSDLGKSIRQLKPHTSLALLLTAVISLLGLVPIWYMRDVFGPVIDSGSLITLGTVTLLLVLSFILSGILSIIRARVFAVASLKVADSLTPRVFYASFAGNLIQKKGAKSALQDLKLLRNFITSPSMPALMETPFGALFLLLVFFIHPLMGFMSLAGAVLVFIVSWRTEKSVRPLVKQGQAYYNAALSIAAEGSRNAQVIEAMGMRKAVQTRWLDSQNNFLLNQASASAKQAFGSAVARSIMLGQGSMVLGIGVALSISGILSPESAAYLIIGKILGNKAIAPLIQVLHSWKSVVSAVDAYGRLDAFLGDVPSAARGMTLPRPKAALTVKNISVRSPSGASLILRDISFGVKPGTVLAIIGRSGSGKTTLTRALIGIWKPVQGTVRLDGADVAAWNKDELGPAIGYLPQDVELFAGSIAENICRFGDLDSDKLGKAVSLSGLKPLIDALPSGLETQIGDAGQWLSGGQRQRIGLARAIYGDPHLIVLDEPNSSLDAMGERDLAEAVRVLSGQGSIIIVVTHRSGLLEVADQLLVLENGKLRAIGPTSLVREKLSVWLEERKSKKKPAVKRDMVDTENKSDLE